MTIGVQEEEFVSLRDVVSMVGLDPRNVRRHIRLLGIAVYEDPMDRRARLVRAEDVARLRQPRLVRPEGTPTTPNGAPN